MGTIRSAWSNSIGAPADPQRWAALEYGADGQITSETLNPQQTLISKGPTPVRQTFRYNSPGLPIAIRASIIEDGVASDCFSETLSYWDEAGADGKTYYYNGQIAGIVHSFGQDEKRAGLQDYGWRFLYDPKGEVQVAENSKFPEYSLGSPSSPVLYDANGNILRLPHGKQVDEFKYFAGTNKLKNTDGSASQSLAYTESGRTKRIDAPPPGTELKYDQVDGLTRAAVDAFGETTFEYGEGDRRAKVLAPDGVARKYYFGVEGRPLAEEYKNETVRFIAGAGRLLAVVGGKTTGYIVADHEMSSRLVLDDHGRLLGGYNYLPFGGQMGKSVGSNPELLRYLYTGQEWDASRGLYNMNARWYDPRTRRFLTPDPQQQFPSPYIYAANDPILFIDPTGEALWDAILSLIGSSIVSALSLVAGVVVNVATLGLAYNTIGAGLIGAGIGGFGAVAEGSVQLGLGKDLDQGKYWTNWGIGTTTGTLSGLITGASGGLGAIGSASLSGSLQLGATATTVAQYGVAILAGGAAGALSGATSQTIRNAAANKPLGRGVGEAALFGAGIGFLAGGFGRLATGATRETLAGAKGWEIGVGKLDTVSTFGLKGVTEHVGNIGRMTAPLIFNLGGAGFSRGLAGHQKWW